MQRRAGTVPLNVTSSREDRHLVRMTVTDCTRILQLKWQKKYSNGEVYSEGSYHDKSYPWSHGLRPQKPFS